MAGVFAEGADKLMAKAHECSSLAGKTEVAV
jgi:hypothetical protein